MIIGFDAKRAFLNNSGLGNYSRTLISSLATYFPANTYVLYTPKTRQTPFAGFIAQQSNCSIQQPQTGIDKKLGSIWRSIGLPRLFEQNGLQLYHGLSNELPLGSINRKTRKVVTIHDLIFIRYPELYPLIDRQIYKLKFKHACHKADLIFATSQQTKEDIVSFFNIPENKIQVVYQSCNSNFQKQPDVAEHAAIKARYHLPANYLLYVGTIEARKNLLTIVKTLNTVSGIPLVVVGKKRAYFNTVNDYIQKYHLQKRVVFLENVADNDLPSIYQQAALFIYPSVFEGFGIPIVEALWSKTPVITSLGSCFKEVGGPHSIYIDPYDSGALADKINLVLTSTAERERMQQEGYNHVQQFHPKTVAEHIMKLYQGL